MDPGRLTGPLLLAQPQDVRDRMARCLRGFSSPATDRDRADQPSYRITVPWGRPLDPWAIRFFIVDVIGGEDLGRAEKVAWEAPLELDGVLIWFAHAKMGIFATVHGVESREAAAELVTDCMRRMGKAVPVVRRDLIDPLVDGALSRGAFTVPNKFKHFFGMYSHLRSLSEQTADRARVSEPVTKVRNGGSSTHFVAADMAETAEYEAVGALFAFFGLLEHLLVMGLAFREYDPLKEPFGGFLRLNWGEKFKRVVGLSGKDDKAAYDTLKLLADENRNPAAHGGVDRNVTNVHVHLAGYGAVPMGVNAESARPTHTFEPQLPASVWPFADYHFLGTSLDGWTAVDRVLAWMETGPLADVFVYGSSGLPMWFDQKSRTQLRAAVAASELEKFIERRGYLIDRASNMDW